MAVGSRLRRGVVVAGALDAIPDKLYFRIGEVAALVGVEPHVLRYWEREVPSVRPGKTSSNQRRYRRRDVEIFREIRRLLHQERYTLAGARQRIAGSSGQPPPASEPVEGVHAENAQLAASEATQTPQLPLGFAPIEADASNSTSEVAARLRAGLVDLIRMAGEEP